MSVCLSGFLYPDGLGTLPGLCHMISLEAAGVKLIWSGLKAYKRLMLRINCSHLNSPFPPLKCPSCPCSPPNLLLLSNGKQHWKRTVTYNLTLVRQRLNTVTGIKQTYRWSVSKAFDTDQFVAFKVKLQDVTLGSVAFKDYLYLGYFHKNNHRWSRYACCTLMFMWAVSCYFKESRLFSLDIGGGLVLCRDYRLDSIFHAGACATWYFPEVQTGVLSSPVPFGCFRWRGRHSGMRLVAVEEVSLAMLQIWCQNWLFFCFFFCTTADQLSTAHSKLFVFLTPKL